MEGRTSERLELLEWGERLSLESRLGAGYDKCTVNSPFNPQYGLTENITTPWHLYGSKRWNLKRVEIVGIRIHFVRISGTLLFLPYSLIFFINNKLDNSISTSV